MLPHIESRIQVIRGFKSRGGRKLRSPSKPKVFQGLGVCVYQARGDSGGQCAGVKQAVAMGIYVVRAFVQLCQLLDVV